ncbi:F-box protein SKIP23 [Cinnamomum micranthum f. kanehirae]|uniref:F-box protein SKIP23 n=1 Tax=Cinnamomum micranthum f. kanehirae TaxID=337451 RepID=A0A443PF37_9MAGN|nr:F-box protein SKIP23 [Cinnamomum micranthum f. kanehirae]
MDKRRLVELDQDLLYWILSHCSLRDCIRMGAVCKSFLLVSRWSTRTRPPQLPWLMMVSNPKSTSAEEARSFFSLSDQTMYDAIKFPEMCGKRCCGSFNNARACGWLMTTDDKNRKMRLFHPWRRIQLQLPTHSNLPRRRYPFDCDDPYLEVVKIRTAAMSDDSKVVVVIHDTATLAFCRRGVDKLWTRVIRTKVNEVNRRGVVFDDVIYHNGQFYTVTMYGCVGVLRINTANPYVEILSEEVRVTVNPYVEILTKDSKVDSYPRTYLVADSTSDRLFICLRNSLSIQEVERDPYDYDSRRTLGFKVYELGWVENGEYKKKPTEVESLGDRVIFLGQNSSMLVMASQFPGFKGNRIYFTDDFMEASSFKSPLGCVDLGIFDMEDKTVEPLFSKRFHPTFSPPIWIAPPL